jgi:Phage portal protein
MATIGSRLKHAWNAFTNRDVDELRQRPYTGEGGFATGRGRSDRPVLRYSTEKSIISSIYTRIGIDVAAVQMMHVRQDADKRYLEDIESGLNNCLTVEANLDQAARQFRQDVAMTILDEGVAAVVPVDTTISPLESGGYDIKTLRVGRVVMWYPRYVTVSLYNEERGMREDITLPKQTVAIIENPLYAVMNEPNSTLQRLIRKLNLLDSVDEQSASGKLDLIIQLPYVIKSETKRQQAEQRRKDIEFQLTGSQYGIAYTEATEKVVQLNRPAENNLMGQVEYLTNLLWTQLGLTAEVMNGTADEKAMKNYYARTIEPLLDAIVESMRRTFLTKTARAQHQSIMYFRDPFKFVPLGGEGGIADIADKFARNEITSSNEIRQGIGMKPRPEAKADALINSNMPQADTGVDIESTAEDITDVQEIEEAPDPAADAMIEDMAETNAELAEILAEG